MMEVGNYYAAGTVLLFVAEFIVRSLGFVKKSDVARVDVLCTEMVNEMFFDERDGAWVENELEGLQLEVARVKTVVEKTFARH